MVFTLGLAGLLSGVALAGVYTWAQPRIERNRAARLEAALYEVLPGATHRDTWVIEDDVLVPFVDPEGRLPQTDAVYGGYDDAGRLLGFAIPAEGGGFQDTIKLLYGVDLQQRRLTGMRVLESLETPGLGDKIIKDEAFVSSFEGLAFEPEIIPVEPGTAGQAHEVDTITGATISSKALVRIINEANDKWIDLLPEGAP